MSHGGHSWHTKDWVNNVFIPVGVAAAATTGLGAAGIGPMAGLFGGGGAAAGAGLLDGATAAEAGGGAVGALSPVASEMYGGAMTEAPSFAASDALAPLGGFDPRAMENGVPNFNTFGAQADLGVAKLKGLLSGADWKKGLTAMNMANQYASLSRPQQIPGAGPPPGMRQAGGSSGQELQQLSQLFSNPAGMQELQMLLRMRGLA